MYHLFSAVCFGFTQSENIHVVVLGLCLFIGPTITQSCKPQNLRSFNSLQFHGICWSTYIVTLIHCWHTYIIIVSSLQCQLYCCSTNIVVVFTLLYFLHCYNYCEYKNKIWIFNFTLPDHLPSRSWIELKSRNSRQNKTIFKFPPCIINTKNTETKSQIWRKKQDCLALANRGSGISYNSRFVL